MSAGELVIVLQFYECAFCVAAGAVVGHAAFAALAFVIMAVVNGGQFAHAIMHVDCYAAGNG